MVIVKIKNQEVKEEKEDKTETVMVAIVLEEKDKITKTATIDQEEKIDKKKEKVTDIVAKRRTDKLEEVKTEEEEEEMIEIMVYSAYFQI